MKLKNIYVGTTKDGKHRVLEKRFRVHDGSSYTVYVDLKTKDEFTAIDIDTDTLIPFGQSVSDKKHATKRKVIKAFKTDMKLKYHVDNLFICDKCKVDWTTSPYISRYYSKKPMSVEPVGYNLLFVKINGEYKDLGTSKIYKAEGDPTLEIGDFCVNNIRNVTEELGLQGVVSKNFALRLHYNKFKRKNN